MNDTKRIMPEFDNSISGFVNEALNINFAQATEAMFSQIFAITNNSRSAMQLSLTKLDEESARLDKEDERMEADNAQLEQTLRAYEDTLVATQTLISANDEEVELSGKAVAPGAVTAKVFIAAATSIANAGGNPVTSTATISATVAEAGINWITPSAVDFAASFVSSAEWIAKLESWGVGYSELAQATIIQGIQNGEGPLAIASKLRLFAENIPLSAAENLTRTLQLTAYREASVAMESINNEFLEYKIRIANLTPTTCLACIDLHGSRLEIGQRVDDHYRGRCTEFYVVPGGPRFPGVMQSDSLPGERNFVPWQSGSDWFDNLSPARQAQQAAFLSTPAKLKAFLDGTPLSAFVGEHVDDVFGSQVIEKSLVGALGDNAEQFYNVNQ